VSCISALNSDLLLSSGCWSPHVRHTCSSPAPASPSRCCLVCRTAQPTPTACCASACGTAAASLPWLHSPPVLGVPRVWDRRVAARGPCNRACRSGVCAPRLVGATELACTGGVPICGWSDLAALVGVLGVASSSTPACSASAYRLVAAVAPCASFASSFRLPSCCTPLHFHLLRCPLNLPHLQHLQLVFQLKLDLNDASSFSAAQEPRCKPPSCCTPGWRVCVLPLRVPPLLATSRATTTV
jgi:hypothetical protein